MLDDLNKLKPNSSEILFINEKIKEISLKFNNMNDRKKIVEIPEVVKEIFSNMKKILPKLNENDIKIKDIITKYDYIENISLTKIREKFYEQNGYYISIEK